MKTLCASFGAALLGTAISTAALAEETTDTTITTTTTATHQALADLICQQAQSHKYIILGDTRHGSNDIRGAVFSDKVLAAIKDCTASDVLVLEGPPSEKAKLQEILDTLDDSRQSVIDSKKSLEELKADKLVYDTDPTKRAQLEERLRKFGLIDDQGSYEDYFKMMIDSVTTNIRLSEHIANGGGLFGRKNWNAIYYDRMRHHGVTAEFYDQGYNLSPADQKTVDILTSTYTADEDCGSTALLYQARAKAADPQQFFTDLDRILDDRLTYDNKPVTDAVMANYPNGAVIFYGSAHNSHGDDLNELLGLSNSVVIDIQEHPSNEPLSEGVALRKLLKANSYPSDQPEFIYNTETNSVETIDQSKPIDHSLRKISEQKFDECRASLPQSIRDTFIDHGGVDFTYQDFRTLMDEGTGMPKIIEDWARPTAKPAP